MAEQGVLEPQQENLWMKKSWRGSTWLSCSLDGVEEKSIPPAWRIILVSHPLIPSSYELCSYVVMHGA